MKIWTLKLLSIPLIALLNFISGFVPYFLICRNIKLLKKISEGQSSITQVTLITPKMKRFLTLANFFCGGVFLSTCLIGLYPGVNKKFSNIFKKGVTLSHYPFAGLTLAFGFFFVWFLEIVVHSCMHCHDQSQHIQDANSSQIILNINNVNQHDVVLDLSLHNSTEIETHDKLLRLSQEKIKKSSKAHNHVPARDNILASIMLTFAIGSHSIIEGLGFGVLDDFSVTVNMLITMLIHESVCAISLGVNIASRRTSLKVAIVLILIFSILIPVGISIGLVVDFNLQRNVVGDVTNAILQGIAAGTFIYVVFIEILPTELVQKQDQFLKLFMMALGFAVIASMKACHTETDVSRSKNFTFYIFTTSSPFY